MMLQAIFEAILRFLFEVVVRLTGEGILWIVTLGRRKFMANTEALSIADLVGLLFWITVGVEIYFLIA